MVATEFTQGSKITTVIDGKEQMAAIEFTQGSNIRTVISGK